VGVGAWSYISLIIISILVVCLGYWKYTNRLLLIQYFAISGAVLFFDYIIYSWGNAYTYYPKIIGGKYDTHIGALINAQIIPSFAILYIAFQLKVYWSIVLACFFTGIEFIFRYLEIFKGHWWKEWYTFVLLVPFFPFMNAWWKKMKKGPKKWLSIVTLVSVFYTIFAQLNVILYGVLKLRTIHVEWIEQLARESTTITSPIGILFGMIVSILIIFEARNFWYFLSSILFLIFDASLKSVGIVHTDHIILESILSFSTFLIPMLFVKYFSTDR